MLWVYFYNSSSRPWTLPPLICIKTNIKNNYFSMEFEVQKDVQLARHDFFSWCTRPKTVRKRWKYRQWGLGLSVFSNPDFILSWFNFLLFKKLHYIKLHERFKNKETSRKIFFYSIRKKIISHNLKSKKGCLKRSRIFSIKDVFDFIFFLSLF